jgi:hypothetical protein
MEPTNLTSNVRKHWPLVVGMGALWLTSAVLVFISSKQNHGHIIYAVDDAYIHMAIAKNFSQHSIWGVTPYAFSSTSSSPLWSLLLSAAFAIFGVNELAPLILNFLFASLVVGLTYAILDRYRLPGHFNAATLLLVVYLAPLPTLVISGMEHSLQVLVVVAFVYVAATILAGPRRETISRGDLAVMALLALLVALTRYEGLMVVFVVCLFLVVRKGLWRGVRYALVLGIVATTPLVIFGIISVLSGWYFLPNSVLLKGAKIDLSSVIGIASLFGLRALLNLSIALYLVSLLIGITLLILWQSKQGKLDRVSTIFGAVIVLMVFLHMQFAQTGSFYRYEAYLVVASLVALSFLYQDYHASLSTGQQGHWLRTSALLLAAMIILTPPMLRAVAALVNTPRATTNVYEQQYQMGSFLRKFYQGEAVAANDIGAVSYLADIRLLDVSGLGSVSVAQKMLSQSPAALRSQQILHLATLENVKIAIVYDAYVSVPPEWIKVGQWTILDNVIAASDTVSFYATNTVEAVSLKQNLRNFAADLPDSVIQAGP